MADACRRTESATDGLDRMLQSMRVSETGREKRTHRACAGVSLPLLDGIARLRFELFHQVDAGVRAPSASSLRPPTRPGNVAGESDGVREASESSAGALVAGAAEPLKETAGWRTLAPVVGCGAARAVEIMG